LAPRIGQWGWKKPKLQLGVSFFGWLESALEDPSMSLDFFKCKKNQAQVWPFFSFFTLLGNSKHQKMFGHMVTKTQV
jgi:hypothetical protein